MRRAGFDLPEMPETPQEQEDGICGQTPFAAACAEVIYQRLHELGGTAFLTERGDLSSMNGFFTAMSFTSLKWGYQDWLERQESASADPTCSA